MFNTELGKISSIDIFVPFELYKTLSMSRFQHQFPTSFSPVRTTQSSEMENPIVNQGTTRQWKVSSALERMQWRFVGDTLALCTRPNKDAEFQLSHLNVGKLSINGEDVMKEINDLKDVESRLLDKFGQFVEVGLKASGVLNTSDVQERLNSHGQSIISLQESALQLQEMDTKISNVRDWQLQDAHLLNQKLQDIESTISSLLKGDEDMSQIKQTLENVDSIKRSLEKHADGFELIWAENSKKDKEIEEIKNTIVKFEQIQASQDESIVKMLQLCTMLEESSRKKDADIAKLQQDLFKTESSLTFFENQYEDEKRRNADNEVKNNHFIVERLMDVTGRLDDLEASIQKREPEIVQKLDEIKKFVVDNVEEMNTLLVEKATKLNAESENRTFEAVRERMSDQMSGAIKNVQTHFKESIEGLNVPDLRKAVTSWRSYVEDVENKVATAMDSVETLKRGMSQNSQSVSDIESKVQLSYNILNDTRNKDVEEWRNQIVDVKQKMKQLEDRFEDLSGTNSDLDRDLQQVSLTIDDIIDKISSLDVIAVD